MRTALEEYRGELERVQPQALVIDAGDPSHLADVTASVEAGCRVLLTALDDATDQLRTSLSDIRGLAVELRDGLQNEAGAALKDSVGDIQQITAELRQELAQLAAFRRALSDGYPAVARAVEHASVKAATRFAELTRTISDLAPAALDQPNGHTTAGPADAEGADPTQWS